MMKDPYREMAERHKQPLEKVQEPVQADGESLQRPVKTQTEKKPHYPLLTLLLVFFIASPFVAVMAFKEEKPAVNETVREQQDIVQDEPAQEEQ